MTSEVLTKDNAEEAAQRWAKFGIKKASERTTQGACIGLYGQGGAGKTLLAAEVYKLGKSLYLDAEAGTDVIAHLKDEPNLDIIDIDSFRKYQNIIDELKKDHFPYENIVVDNLSEIMDFGEIHFGIQGNGSHDLQNYKLLTREMIRRVKDLRELSRKYGINVIFLCWDADEKDDRNVLKKDLALTPALRKEYPGIINILGHVRVLRDPNLRTLDFAPSPKTVAKFRRSPTSLAMEVPFEITYDVDNLPLADVIETIKGRKKWPKDKYKKRVQEQE